jgi:hypothetical protein
MSELAGPGHDELRRLLGGYLLGGLDDADTDRLDAHLLACDECRAELDRLAPVPELLRSLEHALPVAVAADSRPSPARIEGLLARMRAERSREHRRGTFRRLAAAAAAAVLLGGGAVGVLAIRDEEPPTGPPVAAPSQPAVTAVFQASDGSGIAGQAVLTGKTWGVSIDLTVSKLPGRGPFVCRVSNADGTAVEQAASWGPTPSGRARVTGASSIQLPNVGTVAVADHDGRVLGTAWLN